MGGSWCERAASAESQPECSILGVTVDCGGFRTTVDRILATPRSGERIAVHFTTAHLLVEASADERLAALLNRSDSVVTPDGMPLVWLGRRQANPHLDRVYGPDVMEAVIDRGRTADARHFLYGSTPATVERLQARLEERFPGVKIVGTLAPPFRRLTAAEDAEIVQQINTSGADFVWVALGAPKQNFWIAEHRELLHAPSLLAVGAAFDFLAGNKHQAPRFVRHSGLEWLFRLATEPRRLWYRYTVVNARFLLLLARQRKPTKRTRTAVQRGFHGRPIVPAPSPHAGYESVQRAMDIALGGTLLVAALPILLAAAAAAGISTRTFPIYAQRRSGHLGRPFQVFKIRTMARGADRSVPRHLNTTGGPTFKADNDPRITRVGRLLRRTSIDELPQLLSVLLGQMTLVGPRPLPVDETSRLRRGERVRLRVKPGLTGLWQIRGRSDVPHRPWMALDRLYVRKRSLALDLAILLRTPWAVVSMRGAR